VDPADDQNQPSANDRMITSQPGDIWQLGEHVAFCGNCRDTKKLGQIFGSRTADMVFTDPPFNVRIEGHVRVAKNRFEEFAEAFGDLNKEEFIEFLKCFIAAANAVLKPGGVFYAFMDWRHMGEMLAAIEAAGLRLLNVCVWVKSNGGMGSFYRSRHELVFVFKDPKAPHTNNVELGKHGRYRTNVWEYAGATGGKSDEADDFSLHPTVKPVQLVADAILDASSVGQTVFDPFLGSGTTLLAAERTERRCIGVEISPAYIDVAIRRWEALTGQNAIHLQSGETFQQRTISLAAEDHDQQSSNESAPLRHSSHPEDSANIAEDF
jgi:DNA modification methylase